MDKWFKPLKTKITEKILYGFDTETIGENNDFYLGTIYGDDIQKVFYEPEEMIRYFNTQKFKRNCMIVATNLQFDILSLFENQMDMIYPVFVLAYVVIKMYILLGFV